MPTETVHRFNATNGRVMGALGLLTCVVVAVAGVVSAEGRTLVTLLLGCGFFGVLLWAALLRPSVWASADELRMRTMFHDIAIPLASIETAVVRRFLLVRAGGNRYICPAISRPLRKTVDADMQFRRNPLRAPEVKGEHDTVYPDFVEEQITRFAREDRVRRGIGERSEEEYELGGSATKTPSWPEIVAVGVLGVAFVVALVL